MSADFNELALFFMNIGRMVIMKMIAKILQLLQSIKLTGVIKYNTAAAINPSTEKRNIRIVRVK